MKNNARMNKNSGMTLVELLVAMVVGLILLGGVYVSFVSSTTTNSMNEQLSRMQENGRFAIEVLTRDIRMAGYQGCLGTGATLENFLNFKDAYAFNFNESIGGFDFDVENGVWVPELPTTTGSIASNNPMAGSDILVIRSMLSGDIALTTTMPNTAAVFFIPPGVDSVKRCDVLLIADCNNQTAAVFLATSHNINIGNVGHNTGVNPACTQPPGIENEAHLFNYGAGAELFRVNTVSYFIRNVDSSGNPTEPTLYRRIGVSPPEPLVEGVENMQIRYGVDESGNRNANGYYTAAELDVEINNLNRWGWENVVSVRIGLLLRSPSELLRGETHGEPYIVNNTPIVAPDDRRLRTVMSTTVGIRNRLR